MDQIPTYSFSEKRGEHESTSRSTMLKQEQKAPADRSLRKNNTKITAASLTADRDLPTPSPPGSESSQNSRKKQKMEANEFHAQIIELQQEIATVKKRLSSLNGSTNPACAIGKQCIEMKQRAALLKRKLAEHSHWVQRIGSLMGAAPLLDVAVLLNNRQLSSGVDGMNKQQLGLQLLDGWCLSSENQRQSRTLFEKRIQGVKTKSQQEISKLLDDARTNAPSFYLPMRFEARGWKFAAGTLMNNHVRFRCQRCLADGPSNTAKEVAMAFWDFVQRDEVFRTFVPLVQDSVIVYQKDNYSLSRRVLQLGPENFQHTMATVESVDTTIDEEGQEKQWQISLEAVHDPYLCAFVAEAARDFTLSSSSLNGKRDLEVQMTRFNMHNQFAMSARVVKTNEGADILVVGSASCDLSYCRDPAFDLMQHIVKHMPVYEDLYLSSGKTALQTPIECAVNERARFDILRVVFV